MNQHGALGWFAEPAPVEVCIGFAGTHVMPAAINPNLHPGMVVIGVGPTRGVNLTGWDSRGTHSRNREGRFLAASAESFPDGAHGRTRPGIRSVVVDFLMTPMVDFQCSFFHGQTINPGLDLMVVNQPE